MSSSQRFIGALAANTSDTYSNDNSDEAIVNLIGLLAKQDANLQNAAMNNLEFFDQLKNMLETDYAGEVNIAHCLEAVRKEFPNYQSKPRVEKNESSSSGQDSKDSKKSDAPASLKRKFDDKAEQEASSSSADDKTAQKISSSSADILPVSKKPRIEDSSARTDSAEFSAWVKQPVPQMLSDFHQGLELAKRFFTLKNPKFYIFSLKLQPDIQKLDMVMSCFMTALLKMLTFNREQIKKHAELLAVILMLKDPTDKSNTISILTKSQTPFESSESKSMSDDGASNQLKIIEVSRWMNRTCQKKIDSFYTAVASLEQVASSDEYQDWFNRNAEGMSSAITHILAYFEEVRKILNFSPDSLSKIEKLYRIFVPNDSTAAMEIDSPKQARI